MPQALSLVRKRYTRRIELNRLKIAGRIQIVSEVEAQRTNGCLISYSHSQRVRSVVKTAVIELRKASRVHSRIGMQTQSRIRLVPAQQALDRVVRSGKHVAHIVKNGEAESLPQVWQGDGRQAQLYAVYEYRRAAERETGIRVARSCLI